MISTSVFLVVSGIVCLCLSGFMIYRLRPQQGKPPSVWTKTDSRATSAALSLTILMLAGVSMLIKGLF